MVVILMFSLNGIRGYIGFIMIGVIRIQIIVDLFNILFVLRISGGSFCGITRMDKVIQLYCSRRGDDDTDSTVLDVNRVLPTSMVVKE